MRIVPWTGFEKQTSGPGKATPFSSRIFYLCFFALLTRLVLAWLPEKYLFYLISDDAYYYFTIARNLATRGMLSADGITLTNGFHPLWLFLITPIFLLINAQHWLAVHCALTLSALFDTAAGFLIYRVLEKLGKPTLGFWAATFYLVNPYGVWITMNGLETGLNSFFLAGLTYLSVTVPKERLRVGWLKYGLVCGLALLSRTDNILVMGVFLIYVLRRHRDFLTVSKIVLVTTLLTAPWLVYNFATFGTLVQTSGTAYPFLNHSQYLAEHKSIFSWALIPYLTRLSFTDFVLNAFHYGMWQITLLVGVFLGFRLRNWSRETRAALWGLTAAGLFAAFHLLMRWSVRPWYAQAVFVLTLPAIALSLERINRYLLAFAVATVLFLSAWRVQAEPFRLAERSYVILDVVNHLIPPGERVGVFNSGFVQYFTDRKVINLDGLVNNEILEYYRMKKGLGYLRGKNIGWVVDHWVYITKTFGPYWGPAARQAFLLTNVAPDIVYPENTVYLVQFLSDSLRPTYGSRIEIDSVPASKNWVKIPLYPRF